MVRDILSAADRGATVFLNSHLLGEVEITCDRVVFIKDGEVVASHDLSDRLERRNSVIACAPATCSPAAVDALRQSCPAIVVEEGGLLLTARSKEVVPEIVRALATHGADVYEVTPQREPLEEMFVRIIGEDADYERDADDGGDHIPRGGAAPTSVDRRSPAALFCSPSSPSRSSSKCWSFSRGRCLHSSGTKSRAEC